MRIERLGTSSPYCGATSNGNNCRSGRRSDSSAGTDSRETLHRRRYSRQPSARDPDHHWRSSVNGSNSQFAGVSGQSPPSDSPSKNDAISSAVKRSPQTPSPAPLMIAPRSVGASQSDQDDRSRSDQCNRCGPPRRDGGVIPRTGSDPTQSDAGGRAGSGPLVLTCMSNPITTVEVIRRTVPLNHRCAARY